MHGHLLVTRRPWDGIFSNKRVSVVGLRLRSRFVFENDALSSSVAMALVQTSIHQALATYRAQSELAHAISRVKQGEEEQKLVQGLSTLTPGFSCRYLSKSLGVSEPPGISVAKPP